MAENKHTLREWSEQLETGEGDDELLALAAQLKRAAQQEPSAPSVEFRRQLRRDLLNQHAVVTKGQASGLWRWAGSVAAIGLLAVIVVTTWLSISSAGHTNSGDAPLGLQADPGTMPSSDSGYRLLSHSTNGGIVTETVETDDPANPMVTHLLVPGMTMTVTLGWSLPPEAAIVSAFVHLLDDDGQIVAQADAPVKAATGPANQPFAATLALNLPADLPAGEYDLVAGLYDPATGARLPISMEQDQSMRVLLWGDYQVSGDTISDQVLEFSITDAQHDVLHFQVLEAEADALAVHKVSPPAGAAIEGAAPTEFVITVDYALKSLPQAILEVRIVEDLGNESGRGVGLATVDITRGAGTTSVVVRVDPSTELAGAADLGLLLQLKPDVESAPIVTVMPDNVGWPYRP